MSSVDQTLVGIGLYTPSEAERLIGVKARRIARWLSGHDARDRHYDHIWLPQINLGDGRLYLSFRDLMEIRVASAFIERGLSAQKVRKAVQLASKMLNDERPLSTTKFRTDGRTIFLEVLREDGSLEFIDLFKSQYAFKEVIEPSLRNIEFEKGIPARWWPNGKSAGIVVDPRRSFGQPIDADSGVPASVLAFAAHAEGSPEKAARVWSVPVSAVRRAIAFDAVQLRKAA